MDIDEYKYSGYGIGFNGKKKFLVGNRFVKNYIIFWWRYEFFCTCW